MDLLTRREVLATGGLAVAATALPGAGATAGAGYERTSERPVKLFGDGLSLSPAELGRLLETLTADGEVEADYYSNGGVVQAMEKAFAAELGKERAVFFPTGTLANHVAIRLLAGDDKRVLLQERSHVYNDSGDCAQVLSHLNLVPLAPRDATFTAEQVEAELARAQTGRVRADIGVIAIESPVRRKLGEVFELDEMRRVCSLGRERGIRLHLDGARLYMASAYSGVPVRDYAALFDTVYVSLWKYFNAPFGAVLAGPASLLDEAFHTRRMFGGGLPYAWPAAAVALHFLPGFRERFVAAKERHERFLNLLADGGRFRVERIPNGTNNAKLKWQGDPTPEALRERLSASHVLLGGPSGYFRGFVLTGNETHARMEPEQLARLFHEAASG